jgi:hypothetical protein
MDPGIDTIDRQLIEAEREAEEEISPHHESTKEEHSSEQSATQEALSTAGRIRT